MAVNVLSLNGRIAKREKGIPRDIQEEVLKILNANAILYGFYISTWSERRVMKLLKEQYGIKITRYTAKLLLKDRMDEKYFCKKSEENEFNEISELVELGYDVFALYFFKAGIIHKGEIEPFTTKKFSEDKLDINLAIAVGKEKMYIKIIFSETNINFKRTPSRMKTNKSLKLKKKDVEVNKSLELKKEDVETMKTNFVREVDKTTNKNIVFITKRDSFIERLNKRVINILFYIVNIKEPDALLEYYKMNNEIKFIKDLRKIKSRNFKSIAKFDYAIDRKLNEEKIKNVIKYIDFN